MSRLCNACTFLFSVLSLLVIQAGAEIVITKDTFLGPTQLLLEGEAVVIAPGVTLTLSGEHYFSSLVVDGTVTHLPADTGGVNLRVTGAVEVRKGGRIDVTGKGYRGGNQNGHSFRGETVGPGGIGTTQAGADNGGNRDIAGGSYATLGDGATNPLYGSETAPIHLGSGGAGINGDGNRQGGNGGGRVSIVAADFVIDGEILANGGDPIYYGKPGDDGAGSGGSIFLQVTGGILEGSGVLSVDPGVSTAPLRRGGFGRIAIVGFSDDRYTGTIGHAGSVFMQPEGSGGELTLEATTLTIRKGETRTYESLSSRGAASTIFNEGTLVFTENEMSIPPFVTLVQDGIVKGPKTGSDSIGNVIVQNGGVMTHTRGSVAGLQLNVTGILRVDGGGRIDVTGKGYRGGNQEGRNFRGETVGAGGIGTIQDGANNNGNRDIAGGSYGTLGDGLTNPLYGSETAPIHLGSGGAGFNTDPNRQGGNGGGRVHIVTHDLVVDGEILANGGNPIYYGKAGDDGAGSGGSIYFQLTGGTFAGSGALSVDPGVSTAAQRRGGFGRIAVTGFGENRFTGKVGQAGSVFLQAQGSGGDLKLEATTLTVKKGETRTYGLFSSRNSASTIHNEGTLVFTADEMIVPQFVTLVQDGVIKGPQLTGEFIRHVTVQNGGIITHTRGNLAGLVLNVTGTLKVESGGLIDVTGKGYRGGNQEGRSYRGEMVGPGGIGTIQDGADNGGNREIGGGSYGTLGGGPTNPLYGSETAPIHLGSGGAGINGDPNRKGGNGGGRIHLTAHDLAIDGEIVANGGNPISYGIPADGGAGSGGSILLELTGGRLAGSGVVRVNGGVSTVAGRNGGLGRIAVIGFGENAFTGTFGRAGTTFLRPAKEGGDLKLDSTVLTISQDEIFSLASFSSGVGPSTIFNSGTLELTTDALAVPSLVTLVQDGIVKGAARSSNFIGILIVRDGGVITHSRGNLNGLKLNVVGTLAVENGGRLDVTGKGYRGGNQEGRNFRGETIGPADTGTRDGADNFGNSAIAGGSYGTLAEGPTNPLYGSEIGPTSLGSGGAGFNGDPNRKGGNGGGRIHITAHEVAIDGEIVANGGNPMSYGIPAECGAGSGGSILLELTGGRLAGSGVVRVDGGVSTVAGRTGALGRIAVIGFGENAFTGTFGRAGTTFLRPANDGGDLKLDSTVLTISQDEIFSLASFSSGAGPSTIFNSGTLELTTDALAVPSLVTLVQDGIVKGAARSSNFIGSLIVRDGGVITHSRGNLNGLKLSVVGTLAVENGGRLDVTGKGYRGGNQEERNFRGETIGPADTGTRDGADNFGNSAIAGGSYGTLAEGPTNPLYGSEIGPNSLGSGGAGFNGDPNRKGGNGGGRIQVLARDLIVDGQLLAEGGNPLPPGATGNAGAGSGGSILVVLDGGTLSGNGTISVRGGVSPVASRNGGCGRMSFLGHSSFTFAGNLGSDCKSTAFIHPAPERIDQIVPNPVASRDLPIAFVDDSYTVSIRNQFQGSGTYLIARGSIPPGLALSTDGTIKGTARQAGEYSFVVRAENAKGGQAEVALRLEVRERPPRFTRQPGDQELKLHSTLWATAETDLPATFQWFFNKVELPGMTNSSLILNDFAAFQAGVYQVRARNKIGDTFSKPFKVGVLTPEAQKSGVALKQPVVNQGRLDIAFATRPGRFYLIQRSVNDSVGIFGWKTVARVAATDTALAHSEDIEGVQARFIRIVEEPVRSPQTDSIEDRNAFVPLDSVGQSMEGAGLVPDASGQVDAFEMRPGGANGVPASGLNIRFVEGAQVLSTNGETQIVFTHARFGFGPESPLQFDELLEIDRATEQKLNSGPITVEMLETLLGKPPGSGLKVTVFGHFPLTLARGTFDGNWIRGAQFRRLVDGARPFPLPENSGDYPGFDLELDAHKTLRIPFFGSIPLPDGTGTPAVLTVPATRPLLLELRADGQVGVSGHAALKFAGGPEFNVDFSFSDPEYFLRLAAARVSLPPLLAASDLLPRPGTPPQTEDDALWNRFTQRIDWADGAAADLAVLTVNDAAPENAAVTTPLDFTAGSSTLLDMWARIALANSLGLSQGFALEAANQSARTAAASEDLAEAARSLGTILKLQQAIGADGQSVSQALTDSIGAMQRLLVGPCGEATPQQFRAAFSDLLSATATLQSVNHPRASALRVAAEDYLRCYAQRYLQRIGVIPSVYTNSVDSLIFKMQRYEALAHLQELTAVRGYAQALGIDNNLGAPLAEGFMRLALRVWDELRGKLQTALAAGDRRTYLILFSEVYDLEPIIQSGILPDRPERQQLPQASDLQELYSVAFQNGPVEITAQEALGRDLGQMRDDLKRFILLLTNIPPAVTVAPVAVVRNVEGLRQRLDAVVPLLQSRTVFANRDVLAALEAGLLNQRIRLRFQLPGEQEWNDQFTALVIELKARLTADRDWVIAHQAVKILVEAGSANRPLRRACLSEAALFSEIVRTSAAALWASAENRRQANTALRLADMLLPGGIEVDKAAGELRYNSRSRTLSGAFTGQMRLPSSGLALTIRNASFHSGGALDVSLAGSFEVPAQGSLVRFEIPDRRPLHLAINRDRQLTLEGGLLARLQNGMEFEAWASASDPVYRFGAAARGIRLDIAKTLTVNVQVPDAAKLAQLPADLQPLALEYLAALGRTMEPLRDLGASQAQPGLHALAAGGAEGVTRVPEFATAPPATDEDAAVAASHALDLTKTNAALFGLLAGAQTETIRTNIGEQLRRDLTRSLGEVSVCLIPFQDGAPGPGIPYPNAPERVLALKKATSVLRAFPKLTTEVPTKNGNEAGVLRNTLNATIMSPARSVLPMLSALPDSTIKKLLAKSGLEFFQAAAPPPTSNGAPSGLRAFAQTDLNPLMSAFVSETRNFTLAGIGLNANGSVPANAALLTGQSYADLVTACEELTEQELTLQSYNSSDLRYVTAAASLYSARRDLIVRKIREINSAPLQPPYDHELVRDLQILVYVFPLVIETESFGQRVGAEPVRILAMDGSVTNTTREVAGDELIQYTSARMGKLADAVESAMNQQRTPEDRKLITEFIVPELRKWTQNKQSGLPVILGPFQAVFAVTNRTVPPGMQAGLKVALKEEIENSSRQAASAPTSGARTPDLLESYKESLSVAEFIEAGLTNAETKSELLAQLKSNVIEKWRATLILRARAEESWDAAHAAAERALKAIQAQAGRDATLLRQTLSDEFTITRDATAELIGVVRDRIRTTVVSYDMNLAAAVTIREVHGQLLFNRATRFVSGEFGGRLEFPRLEDSSITLQKLSLDTEGNYSLNASAEFPLPASLPGFSNPRFRGTLTANGQKAIERSFDGTLHFTGEGNIIGGNRTLGATVTYDQLIENNQPQWRLNVSVSGDVNLRLGNDFVLFKAAAGAGTGNTPGGSSVRLGGKAGLFRKDRDRELPADESQLRPDLFQVLVEDVDFLVETNNNVVTVQLRGGKLRLPPLFKNLSAELCPALIGQSGVEISVVPTNPITVTFDSSARPPVQFSGAIGFQNIGFAVPLIPGMEAALCSAELHFASDQLPELRRANGALKLPIPNQEDAFLDLSDGTFSFNGIPTGAISLREDATIADIGGMQLAVLGAQSTVTGTQCATRFVVTEQNGIPQFNLSGGLRVTLPADVFTGEQGDAVEGVACGAVSMTFPPNREPTIDLALTEFQICAQSLHLSGRDGIVITNTCLRVANIAQFFTPTEQDPFIIEVSGGIRLPNGPGFSLQNAQLRFFDPERLPDFTFRELSYSAEDWQLVQALPVRVTRGALTLKNPLLPFPQRYQPENVQITISADVSIPPSQNPAEVVLGGAVDNLIVEFGADGFPKPPSIDGFELTLAPGKLKIPPIEELGGKLRIGGLQSDSINKIYIVGRLGGSYLTYRLAFQAAFNINGPVGLCLDANLGPTGIIIAPTPFQITGASGGLSFLNSNSDPCAFESFFEINPRTGNKELKSSSSLLPTLSWGDFRAVLNRMQQEAQKFPPPGQTPAGFAGVSALQATDSDSIDCPGDCPPATVNILCQPHPDRENYPNRIIFKFTAIDESTLNDVLQIRPETFTSTGNDLQAAARLLAGKLTNLVYSLTPPIPAGSFAASLKEAQTSALQMLYAASVQSAAAAFSANVSLSLYERVKRFAWEGIPCQDVTLAVAGRGSIVGASVVGYVEGRMVASTAGSAGLIGKLHVLGVPVGQARGFISWTDANGDPNPSLCGEAGVSFGPLELGQLRMNMTCDECVSGMLGIAPTMMRVLGEPLLRDILSRVAPYLPDLSQMTRSEIIELLAQLPSGQRFAVLNGFFAELMNQPPGNLPSNIAQAFRDAIRPVLARINPQVTFCGEVQPKLFGFPLGPGPDIFVGAQVSLHEGYIGEFAFSPGFFLPIFPPGDRATLSWSLPVTNPAELLSAAIDGRFSSASAALEFAREQTDNLLENTAFALEYQFHPFGLKVADAGARLILPDLLNHPAMPGATWRLPEERGLPSREKILIAAAVSNVLGQAFLWHGTTNDFASIFPTDSAEFGQLTNLQLDLRKDYFPHGGLMGGGRLALPLILSENPENWLAVIRRIQNEQDPFARLTSAIELVNDHILAMTTNGTFAFYLPAPNPLAIYNRHPAPRSLTAAEVLDSIKEFDFQRDLRIGPIYPANYAFAQGQLDGAFIGVPIGSASISATLVPQAGATNLGTMTATAPAGSWVAELVGRPVDLTFLIPAPPAVPIDTAFSNLAAELTMARSNVLKLGVTAASTLAANSAVDRLTAALDGNLPKAHFVLPFEDRSLSGLALKLVQPTLYGFSPRFQPDVTGQTPLAIARREGGLGLSGGLKFLGGVVDAPLAELSVTPGNIGLPRIAGMISNVTVNPPTAFGPVRFQPRATAQFDSGQEELLRVTGTVPSFSLGSIFSFTALIPGAPLNASFAVNKIPPPPSGGGKGSLRDRFGSENVYVPNFNPSRLELDPIRLAAPAVLGATSLILHGNGGESSRIVVPTFGGIEARASFNTSAPLAALANNNHSLDLKVGSVIVARLSGLPKAAFHVSGFGLDQFALDFDFTTAGLPDGLHVVPFPNGGASGIPDALRNGVSIVPAAGGTLSFRLDSSGAFQLAGTLASPAPAVGFPGLQMGARVTINNSGVFLSGTAPNNATVSVSIPVNGAFAFNADLSVGPWEWLNGAIRISAADGGPFRASAGSTGFTVPNGARITLRNLSGTEQSATVTNFTFDANYNFAAALSNLASVANFPISNLSATLSGHPGGNIVVNFQGDLDLPNLLRTGVKGEIGNQRVRLERTVQNSALMVGGVNLENVSASFNAPYGQRPDLTLSGQLPWTFLPDTLRTMSGTLRSDGFLDLNSSLTEAFGNLGISLENTAANFSNAADGTPRLYLDATLSGSGTLPAPSSLRGLTASGYIAPDRTGTLSIDIAGRTISLAGIDSRNSAAGLTFTPLAWNLGFGGDLWLPNLSPGARLGSISGTLRSDGGFSVVQTNLARAPFAGFPLYFSAFSADGNWRNNTGSASVSGVFEFPHNAGNIPFSGTLNPALRTFTIQSGSDPTLNLGSRSFKATGQMTLNETKLTASGKFKLGSISSTAAELSGTLELIKNGDIIGRMSGGNTDWTEFPGVWGWLDWTGTLSYVNNAFQTTFSGTFYGATPNRPARPSDRLAFPAELKMSSCRTRVCGPVYRVWDNGRFVERQDCLERDVPCPPATLRSTVEFFVAADGNTAINPGEIGGINTFEFRLQ